MRAARVACPGRNLSNRQRQADRNVTVEVLQAVATALQVRIKNQFNIQPHPLEVKLNAASSDILSAIEKGFCAIIDTKGNSADMKRLLKRGYPAKERPSGLFAGGPYSYCW